MGLIDFDMGSIVGGVGEILDDLVTTEEEKLQINIKLKEMELNLKLSKLNERLSQDKEVTNRWVSDKDHMVTRLVRPMIVIWIAILLTAIILFDGNIGEYSIKHAYVPLIETLATTIFVAYFGSRGAEKITKALKEHDNENSNTKTFKESRERYDTHQQDRELSDDALWYSSAK